MKRPFLQRLIAATVVIGAVLGTASVAQARPDVHVSIDLPGLPGLPVPVLVPPPLPRPFIRAEPVYVQPRPVYQAPPVAVYEDSWRHREWQRREWERRHHGWDRSSYRDRDGDGVPNRYDRRPDDPYRR